MNKTYHTIDIKLASCLDSLGIPYRESDPVTKVIQERDGKKFEQCTFWFDIIDDDIRQRCKIFIDAYEAAKPMFIWKLSMRKKPLHTADLPAGDYYQLEEEHPLYYIMDGLFLREAWLSWMRENAEPMRVFRDGNKTVTLSTRATQETRDKMKKALTL